MPSASITRHWPRRGPDFVAQENFVTHKLMIVDDSKLARMAIVKVLDALHPDWSRVEASNADEALRLVREQVPDIALLDYNMPGKDGLALVEAVRQLNPDISVAVISANRQVEVIDRARAAGATFLAKPLTTEALQGFLATAVKQRETRAK